MDIYKKIKGRRKELGLTMLEIANKTGVSEATVSRWESGDIANMRRDKIVSLANALQVSPSFIMEEEEQPPIGNINKITVYAMNGEKSVDSIEVNEDNIEEIAELVSIANQLPKEKVQALINTANAMK